MTPTTEQFIRANATLTAAEIVALNQPIKTPKSGRVVTFTTLCSGVTGWGPERAEQFIESLEAIPQMKAFVRVITGAGLDPSDPTVAEAVGQLVGAKLCTQDEADKVLVDITYPAGVETLIEADVRAVLDALVVKTAMLAREARIVAGYNAAMAMNQGGETDMTVIQAAFDGAMS